MKRISFVLGHGGIDGVFVVFSIETGKEICSKQLCSVYFVPYVKTHPIRKFRSNGTLEV
jgi:hypothetical protein